MRLSVIALMLLFVMQLNGQHYTRDAGIRAGAFLSFCYRQYYSEDKYSEVIAGINPGAIRVTYLKEYMQPALQRYSPNLYFVYGYGGHTGINRLDHYRFLNRNYFYKNYRYSPVLGVDGYLGIEYHFPRLPIIAGIDTKPFFEFSMNRFFGIYFFDTSLNLKVKF
jgi:hypothetical protein